MRQTRPKSFRSGGILFRLVILLLVSERMAAMILRHPFLFRRKSPTVPSFFLSSRLVVSRVSRGGKRRERSSSPSKIWFVRGGGGASQDSIIGSVDRPFESSATTRSAHSTTVRADVSGVNDDYQSFLEQHPDKVVLSYITDIEGDKFYLDRYVETSKVLTSVPRQAAHDSVAAETPFPYDRCIDFSSPNGMLVFGGDLWDKGGYDLYVARQLLDLKRRHPHRVLWVLGNRDINKLRILQELGLPGRPVPPHPGLTWFRGTGRVGDPDGPLLPPTDAGGRLKWILSQTMGSPEAMEHRRQELAWEGQLQRRRRRCGDDAGNDDDGNVDAGDDDDPIEISDEDVVRSYRESCHPRGELGLFLSQARLALTVGPILFVHGSLPLTPEVIANAKLESRSVWDDMTFAMPWIVRDRHNDEETSPTGTSKPKVEGIEDWIDALNQFCWDTVDDWKSSIEKLEAEGPPKGGDNPRDAIWAYRAGYDNGPPYTALIQYGVGMTPDGRRNPTVVYNSFTPEGMPKSFFGGGNGDGDGGGGGDDGRGRHESDVAACTREFFDRTPVRLILTGHKPQGDMPSPIWVTNSSWVICADTSYSGDTHWWHDGDDQSDDAAAAEAAAPSPGGDGRAALTNQRGNLGRGNARSFRGDVAVSEVLVELSGSGQRLDSVRYHGVLSDGTEYQSVNLLEPSVSNDSCLGRAAPHHLVPPALESPHQGRWWTKSIFSDGSHLFYAGEGFRVWNYVVKEPTAAAVPTSADHPTTTIE